MSQDTCAVEDCDRAARARGWCIAHYERWRKYGDPMAGGIFRTPDPEECTVTGCHGSPKARGWCGKHYSRWRQHGDPLGGGPDKRQGPPAACKVEGCEEPCRTLGWCKRHYQKYWKSGDPLTPDKRMPPGTPLRERIEARIAKTAQCWFWLGPLNQDGYGYLNVEGKNTGAHRASYMAFVGPIPDGMVIDHLCRNRACVRPDHLEAIPQLLNVRRGAASDPHTHCRKGHEYTPENTRVVQVCLVCDHDARERRARRKRAAKQGAA